MRQAAVIDAAVADLQPTRNFRTVVLDGVSDVTSGFLLIRHAIGLARSRRRRKMIRPRCNRAADGVVVPEVEPIERRRQEQGDLFEARCAPA